jgi:hypothetical protein
MQNLEAASRKQSLFSRPTLSAFQLNLGIACATVGQFVAREGIERFAESLLFKAFPEDRKRSYPRCYPQPNSRKTAIEPGTLV